MGFKFENCTIDRVGSIVKAENADINVEVKGCRVSNIFNHAFILTSNSNLDVKDTSISNAHKGLLKVSNAGFFEQIGLDPNTDINEFKALINQLKQSPSSERNKIINESFLSNTANLTTIGLNILQILPYINF